MERSVLLNLRLWASLCMLAAILVGNTAMAADEMIIIAHRGASGERPEHTLAAYELAIDQGADYIEPDLVVTKDGVLVARHENEISSTTDVAQLEEFANRQRSKTIDGELISGWFAEDFTLAELRQLRAKERIPGIRPQNARYDGLYQVPTLAEIVQMLRAKQAETGRKIGLYPELKHPNFLLQEQGVDMVDLLLLELRKLEITPDDPIFIQCFEIGPLQRLNQRSDFQLIQLVAASGGPADEPHISYSEMLSPTGMAGIAKYADGVGADIRLTMEEDGTPSALVTLAHANDLLVHGWTARKENAFLPAPLQQGDDPAGQGDMAKLIRILDRIGVDGVFTDDPAVAVAVKAATGGAR